MKKTLITILISLFFAANLMAAGSSTQSPAVSKDVKLYNKGVTLMLEKKFAKAEKQFRKSLRINDQFAEAHNNLAYTLRKQGAQNYEEALAHYNKAIELGPGLPEPYMYRGVLHVQMGNKDLALKDHKTLLAMQSALAVELEYVITEGHEKEPEQFFGVSRKIS
jgi:tetratricopeptide (TPR) repeat protein